MDDRDDDWELPESSRPPEDAAMRPTALADTAEATKPCMLSVGTWHVIVLTMVWI